MTRRDPVEAESDDARDLYDVATWEVRSALDRLAVAVYGAVVAIARGVVVALGLLILVSQFLLGGLGATVSEDPTALVLVVLSVVPALLLAAYIYVADVTTSEPLELVVATFILGVVFAGFAAILNALLSPLMGVGSVVGVLLFFYLVVGPVEESVKLLAVRLYAYRSSSFDAVIDGAVYGAVAGLGFATIENALYISRGITSSGGAATLGLGGAEVSIAAGSGLLAALGIQGTIGNIIGQGGQITAFRALAGPGHVIYSAFAGYYLGLAKFNRENAGPIAVKGLLVAAFIHGTYNVLAGIVPFVATEMVPGLSQLTAFIGFVLVYDGVFLAILLRKIRRYRKAFHAVGAARGAADYEAEATEFER